MVKVDVLAAGEGVVEQDGRQAHLRAGDLVFVDLTRPARWRMSAGLRWVAVVFPPSALPLARDELARLTAVRIPGGEGAAALGVADAAPGPAAGSRCRTAASFLLRARTALADPCMIGAMTSQEVARLADDHGLRFVRFLWCGNDGTIRAKASGRHGLEGRLERGIGVTVGMQAMNSLDQLQPVPGHGAGRRVPADARPGHVPRAAVRAAAAGRC